VDLRLATSGSPTAALRAGLRLCHGLRSSEIVGATLGQIETDAQGDHWLKLLGKGSKAGKVALPPLARVALDHYLMQRGVPTTPALWKPSTPLIADLTVRGGHSRITSSRLWDVTKRFFMATADAIEASPRKRQKSCAEPVPIGCATPMPHMLWPKAPN
jgi:integrase